MGERKIGRKGERGNREIGKERDSEEICREGSLGGNVSGGWERMGEDGIREEEVKGRKG